MLQPKRVKFRKHHRGHRRGQANAGNQVSFGDIGLQALGNAWIDSRQIEAARRAITHHIKRGGKVWIRIFPDKPVTAKPAETRMGSGKGAPDHWVAVVKPGRMLFEMSGVREEMAREALRLASHKLSVETRIVLRQRDPEIDASGNIIEPPSMDEIAEQVEAEVAVLEAQEREAAEAEAAEAEAAGETADGEAEGDTEENESGD